MSDPVIDARTAEDIVDEAQKLRAAYTPEWTAPIGDSGFALISIFARLMEIMISRLNRVPEKNFLAFLDTAGVRLLAPNPARAPVRFITTTGAKKDGEVPAGTQLATAPPPGLEPLTFETEEGLIVSRSRLVYIVSYDPAADMYIDRQSVVIVNAKNTASLFKPFVGTSVVPHRLYLTHDPLFKIDYPTKLSLDFRVANLSPDISKLLESGLQWKARSGKDDIRPISALTTINQTTRRVTVVLDGTSLNAIGNTQVNETDGYWIQAETKDALSPSAAKVEIGDLSVHSEATGIKPSLAFSNAVTLDLQREYYPFGERPKTYDTFFLALPEVLTKAGSIVTLVPKYVAAVAGDLGVTLSHEFWNGSEWQALGTSTNLASSIASSGGFEDTTHAFTAIPTSGTELHIRFICPAMAPVEVNGKKNYWLRIRIIGGNYGVGAQMTLNSTAPAPPAVPTLADWTYKAETFAPPVITSFVAAYEYKFGLPMTAVVTENNFTFATLASAGTLDFFPFGLPDENQPACYLGFDSAFSQNGVSIYIEVDEAVLTVKPVVVWEYWDGTQWKNLGVQDETTNLTKSGIVKFIGPGDDAKAGVRFGNEAYWIRARLDQGDKSLIQIRGIYLNTVWARNSTTLANELLGSSSETPNATFQLSRFPVLDGLQVEVREPERPSDEDLKILFAEEGTDAVNPVSEGDTATRENWVRWHRVDHFRFSGKKSRHYTADWFNGVVQFGDGIRGMVPPAGKGNIRAKQYKVGGGANGNVPRNTLTVLRRAIPFVDKAFNVDDAGGGSDGESLEHVRVRGPQAIKNRNRAVTWEDYEWLAREASFEVARARCLQAQSKDDAGQVRLILVPLSDAMKPYPSQGLIQQVQDYISPRARRIATADLVISGPKYVEISIAANVFPEKIEEADLVRRRVKAAVTRFFHPLRGGPDNNGWEFGRDVFVSEVSKVIEDTDGVHHAEDVEICSSFYEDGRAVISMPGSGDETQLLYQVDIGDEFLVASGEHRIAIAGKSEPNLSVLFLGNRHTKEFHNLRNQKPNCHLSLIDPKHKELFSCMGPAIRKGYDFCAWCFSREWSRF